MPVVSRVPADQRRVQRAHADVLLETKGSHYTAETKSKLKSEHGEFFRQYNLEQFKSKLSGLEVQIIANANHHMVNEIEPLRREIFAALRL